MSSLETVYAYLYRFPSMHCKGVKIIQKDKLYDGGYVFLNMSEELDVISIKSILIMMKFKYVQCMHSFAHIP